MDEKYIRNLKLKMSILNYQDIIKQYEDRKMIKKILIFFVLSLIASLVYFIKQENITRYLPLILWSIMVFSTVVPSLAQYYSAKTIVNKYENRNLKV